MGEQIVLKNVRAALEKDTRINLHLYPVNLAMHGGDLILTGEMESIAAKKVALLLAAATHGVQRIVDRLKVAPAEKMGDAEIRDHVRKALLGEPVLERYAIDASVADVVARLRQTAGEPGGWIVIDVKDGVVTLNGEVPSLAHKRLAGVLAWWVPGTTDVVNGLEEVPPEEDNEDELIDAVRLALEKDPFVDAADVRVTSTDWVVTLEGLVPTETMKQMAERDVWCVLGVKSVINKVEISR
jgi:osmotically-inducible protein OsmY